jgi:hypothetical protein
MVVPLFIPPLLSNVSSKSCGDLGFQLFKVDIPPVDVNSAPVPAVNAPDCAGNRTLHTGTPNFPGDELNCVTLASVILPIEIPP